MAKKMRVVIFNNNRTLLGKLAKLVTGVADYHIGFTDEVSYWDQGLMFRKRPWAPPKPEEVTMYMAPVNITAKELDTLVFRGVEKFCDEMKFSNLYGLRDYINFGLRKLGIGYKVNFKGWTCGGVIRDVLANKGWTHLGGLRDFEPSPAEVRLKFIELGLEPLIQGELN